MDEHALPRLMVERLSWMDEVAEVKRARALPVSDPVREAELLKAMEQRGAASGLPAGAVRAFFSGQMQAARQLQQEWLQRPSSPDQKTGALPDLAGTVRPALDEIGIKMISCLTLAHGSAVAPRITSEARLRLSQAGYSEAVIRAAIEGLEAGLRQVMGEHQKPLTPAASESSVRRQR
ncbi:MAG: chorismate mutase [Prosthecobacter sp.]|jgi:chorismate mutase-like protein